VGVVGITTFRPFPLTKCDAARERPTVIVIEKAFSVGYGGVLSADVASATHTPRFRFTPSSLVWVVARSRSIP